MKTKPLRIDWDLLEEAFSSKNEIDVYFLDLVTGKVALDGEGSEEDDPSDDDHFHVPVGSSIQSNVSLADDATRLEVRPPSTSRKIKWLEEFLPGIEAEQPDLVAELTEAMKGANPSEIADVLNRHPDGRDSWFMFRETKVQQMIEEWLAEHSVQFIDPPPWRGAS